MEIYSQFRVIVAVAAVLLSFKLESSSPTAWWTGQKRSEVAADHREPGKRNYFSGHRGPMEIEIPWNCPTICVY